MEELFVIIPKLPGVRVYQFSDSLESSKSLCEFCQEQGHYLEIVALRDDLYEKIKDLPAKVRRLDEDKERYNLRSMQFDTVFVNYDITKLHDPEQFLRKIYRMMKNAGDLLLFLDEADMERYAKLLEDINYVAINPIHNRNSVVLSAKKMHGWQKV
ncbi:methyltransferase domain-containing protein [Nitratiruptor sp. YY09-18]|uniref:methyltransferase domain-containing protein n=1 Tax=Nitratiruptor sp. YY09-18 TaxID=2724901 RepID=UPI0019169A8F|nr:methyltransferase domain-containing protein [Nitratiruptor sp. YY09-18]BCD67204.1 hypothetical protein NitYY0918_C0074 [Nitratiruptor sp. YY09-18]